MQENNVFVWCPSACVLLVLVLISRLWKRKRGELCNSYSSCANRLSCKVMLLSQETAKRMGYGIGFFISWKEMPNLRSNLPKSCPKPNLARSSLYTNKLWKQFKWTRELVSFQFCFTWWAFSYSKDVSQVSFLVSKKYYQSFSFESNDQVHYPKCNCHSIYRNSWNYL